jgi:U4/U6.U5 tri-snRNP component SNU23
MADKRGGDTDFRRTFNKEEAAARGAERERKEREEGKARYEAKLEGKKYHRRASTPPDARETEARSQRLDVASMIGKTMLVSFGALACLLWLT